MKKFLSLTFFVSVSSLAFSQQDPQFSQNMFNMLQPNPATAGANDAICASLIYRNQWVEFEGSPKTGVLSVDAPISFLHGGAGITLMTDKLGFEKSFPGKTGLCIKI